MHIFIFSIKNCSKKGFVHFFTKFSQNYYSILPGNFLNYIKIFFENRELLRRRVYIKKDSLQLGSFRPLMANNNSQFKSNYFFPSAPVLMS